MQSYARAENKGLRICDEAITKARAYINEPVAWQDLPQPPKGQTMKDRPISLVPIPATSYPLSAWERVPEGVDFAELWKICGSTVERHIDVLPQWKVYCALYFEGLVHGSQIEQQRATKKLSAKEWSD